MLPVIPLFKGRGRGLPAANKVGGLGGGLVGGLGRGRGFGGFGIASDNL
jgi:hypothetical protein